MNSNARTSMILGIISLFCFGIVLGLIAIYLSTKAKNEILASGGMQQGEGMATAGMVLGILGVIGSIITLALLA